MLNMSGPIDLTIACSKYVTAPNVTEKRGNKKKPINNFFDRKENVFLKNPQTLPFTGTRTRRTCGPKIGFNKEDEIVYNLCFILLKPI